MCGWCVDAPFWLWLVEEGFARREFHALNSTQSSPKFHQNSCNYCNKHRPLQHHPRNMAKAKARTTIVQLVSSAKTGYRRTLLVPRTAPEITQVRYDPIVQRHVLFTESKKRKGEQPKPLDFSRGAFAWKKK